jgi:NAD(P)-dependent dehydrogenase (short-subunit alcohol dehydrogenase family)
MVLDNGDGATEWVKNLAQEHGPLNGIFHAAGIELVRPVRLTKDADVQKLFGAALYPAMGIARAVAQKGVVHDAASIVFMSSVAAQCGQSGMSAYCASKAAVDGLVRALSCEFAARKIRVNSIVAGAVVTEMHHRLTQTMGQDALTKYEEQHLLGFGSQDDVADAAIFLLSSASKWITGSSMAVDGGYMVR